MNKAVFITVRTGSSRLPQKALLEIQSLPTIVHLIRRIKKVSADVIVLCTTELPEDDILCDLARSEGIECYRGSVKDKLERWHEAAQNFNVDFFVTADGDDLFCEPELIEMAFRQYQETNTDFLESPNVICGAFTYGIKAKALEKVCEIKDTDDTEMMWTYFKDTNMFSVAELGSLPPIFVRDDIRMTMDYEEDFIFFKRIIDHFYEIQRTEFSLRDIVNYLDENPSLIDLNKHRHVEWAENQIQKTNLAIKAGK